jgi:hypothetical protein
MVVAVLVEARPAGFVDAERVADAVLSGPHGWLSVRHQFAGEFAEVAVPRVVEDVFHPGVEVFVGADECVVEGAGDAVEGGEGAGGAEEDPGGDRGGVHGFTA